MTAAALVALAVLTGPVGDWREAGTAAVWADCQSNDTCGPRDPQSIADSMVNGIEYYDQLDPSDLDRRHVDHAAHLIGPCCVVLGPAVHTEFGVPIVRYPAPVPINDGTVGGPLDCIAFWESERYEPVGVGYGEDGLHSGRYQFSDDTWPGAVTRAGHPEWADSRAADAPSDVQDSAAALLFSERGWQPWPSPARWCA